MVEVDLPQTRKTTNFFVWELKNADRIYSVYILKRDVIDPAKVKVKVTIDNLQGRD